MNHKDHRKLLGNIIAFLFISLSIFAQNDCDNLIERAIEATNRNDFVSSQELLSKAKLIADSKHLHQKRFMILNIMGVNHAKTLNYNDALDHFLEAYRIASKELDVSSEMSIMNNLAGLYLLDHRYKKANEYYKKVFEQMKKTRDTLFIGGCAMNIVLTASYLENVKEAETYLRIASDILQDYPGEMLRVKSLEVCNLRQKGHLNSAEKMALNLLPALDSIENNETKNGVALELVEIYRETGKLEKAIYYAKMALKFSHNLEERKNIFELLSDLYLKKQDYRTVVLYKDSFILTTDSLNKINNEKRFENSRIRFELLMNEKKLSDSQAKLKMMWLIFIFSGLLGVTLVWAFINKLKRDKQHKTIVELELSREKDAKLLLENKLKEQETQALLRQERLKNEQRRLEYEIELKNKKLVSKALIHASRNELIGNLVNAFSESQGSPSASVLQEKLRQLKNQLKENGEWSSFTTHFEQTNQRFITALKEKHPQLKANEIRLLSFIYINLNTKEISSLMNITPEYCKKKKQQISKKMGLSSTSELYNYLFTL